MKHAAFLALLLGLAGCDTLALDSAYPDANCRTAMYQDPAVRTAIVATSNSNASAKDFADVNAAKNAFYQRCVSGGGKPGVRGGVQRVTS